LIFHEITNSLVRPLPQINAEPGGVYDFFITYLPPPYVLIAILLPTMMPSTTQAILNTPQRIGEYHKSRLWILCLTALGVVYGDIGTSPLYAVRECFFGPHRVAVTQENVLGVLSLIFWALAIVVALKYHVYVLRADNRGEGGILALMALVHSALKERKSAKYFLLTTLGLFGAALLYGDGMLTPAISVLSAVEGLEIATPLFSPYVVPITILILIGLFMFQRRGTAGVGAVFGPVIFLWFSTLAILGLSKIIQHPTVLAALNPMYAIHFFEMNGFHGYLVLGAVFLVATGGEALYADLGHFGETPIQIDWFCIVGISLILNYFGQGALLLMNPAAARNPFYLLAPNWALYPLVILSTAATIIASQAVISGVFSLTRQASQLGYAPRINVVHTSAREIGQIYIPGANWGLMVATIAIVLGFKTSSNLAAAYGVAVTSTMIITTILAYFVARHLWHWNVITAALVTAGFLFVDLAFFGANAIKVAQGGWFPLLVGLFVFTLFTTWKRGRESLATRLQQTMFPLQDFIYDAGTSGIARVPGTAVFLNSDPNGTPIALLHNIKHNMVLHQKNVMVTILTEEVPHVSPKERLYFEDLGKGFYKVVIRYGFMEDPNVPVMLRRLHDFGLDVDPEKVTYILSRNTLLPSKKPEMALWREKLFFFLTRNASRPTEFFRLPPNRVVELGMQIEI
jgi:KUP system potassium uptake protein